jgi:hypothetical protein
MVGSYCVIVIGFDQINDKWIHSLDICLATHHSAGALHWHGLVEGPVLGWGHSPIKFRGTVDWDLGPHCRTGPETLCSVPPRLNHTILERFG